MKRYSTDAARLYAAVASSALVLDFGSATHWTIPLLWCAFLAWSVLREAEKRRAAEHTRDPQRPDNLTELADRARALVDATRRRFA